ncbi:MAG TPA: hypothetical protein PLJ99_02480 [Kiritimatiellia bacterium]|nr:hypothetical protein [Kiritimatiellia bacterium]HPJ56707.1 hypothetical protein [Kiritimatiellia bacterium]HPR68137.1 hypothetical protein [Kiritimatiellia bacterium]
MTPDRIPALLLAVLFLAASASAQRIEFQRQKFDRSRFERPAAAVRPDLPEPEPAPAFSAPAPAAPAPAEPAFPPPTSSPATEFSSGDTDAGTPPADGGSNAPESSWTPRPPAVDPALQALIDSPHFDGLPTKISKDPRDHEELLALQKQTGACLFLYFKNPNVTSESGLCGWYEKHVAGDMGWRKAMRYYLQMEITLPGKKDAQELAALYRVTKTPALLVVQPGSTRPGRLWPFEKNPGEGMKLKEMDAILQELKAASTPAYADVF